MCRTPQLGCKSASSAEPRGSCSACRAQSCTCLDEQGATQYRAKVPYQAPLDQVSLLQQRCGPHRLAGCGAGSNCPVAKKACMTRTHQESSGGVLSAPAVGMTAPSAQVPAAPVTQPSQAERPLDEDIEDQTDPDCWGVHFDEHEIFVTGRGTYWAGSSDAPVGEDDSIAFAAAAALAATPIPSTPTRQHFSKVGDVCTRLVVCAHLAGTGAGPSAFDGRCDFDYADDLLPSTASESIRSVA